MRQRNAKTGAVLDAFKAISGETQKEKLHVDMANGRVFYERTLLAQRKAPNEAPTPIMEGINKIYPTVTREDFDAKLAEVIADREKSRNPS